MARLNFIENENDEQSQYDDKWFLIDFMEHETTIAVDVYYATLNKLKRF